MVSVTGTKRYGRCPQCDRLHQREGIWCSTACRVAAYRRRHDPDYGTWKRRRDRAQTAARTKALTYKLLICQHCAMSFEVSVASSTNRRYCTDACRQAAYRKRKAGES